MKIMSVLLFFSFCPTVQASAQTSFDARRATRVNVVEDMTCAQAANYVIQHKRYYKMTAHDGAIPIFPIKPVNQNPTCGSKQRVSYELVPTVDDPKCLVGYTCVST
jgi:hypothetical protein